MGWDYTLHRARPGEVTQAFTRAWVTEGGAHIEVTDPAWAGFRHLWGIYRVNGEPQEIVLWLVDFRRDSWGYKDMGETEYPYYYDCPLSLLAKCPCPDSDGAREWRERVRAYHAKRARQWAIGQKVRLVGRRIGGDSAPVVTIVSLRPLRGSYYGQSYRLTKGIMAEAAPVAL